MPEIAVQLAEEVVQDKVQAPLPEEGLLVEALLVQDLLVEDVSIDGMCGVY